MRRRRWAPIEWIENRDAFHELSRVRVCNPIVPDSRAVYNGVRKDLDLIKLRP